MMPGGAVWLRVIAVMLASAVLIAWVVRPPPALVDAGHVSAYPRGSVTRVRLAASFDDPLRPHYRRSLLVAQLRESPRDLLSALQAAIRQELIAPVGQVTPVGVYLVHDDSGVYAFYDRDPLTGCRLDWVAAERHFEDHCSYSAYAANGQYLRGPAARSLDQFAVELSADGEVRVDVDAYHRGPEYR
jgi:hypothetical protein